MKVFKIIWFLILTAAFLTGNLYLWLLAIVLVPVSLIDLFGQKKTEKP